MKELFDIIWDFMNTPFTVYDFTFRLSYFVLFSLGVSFIHMVYDFYWDRGKGDE